MTHHFFRGGFCEHAHDQHSERGDHGQDHGEVEIVHVLHHAWSEVDLATLGLWVDEVQHQPNDAQQQPNHQAPECALGKEGYSLSEREACIHPGSRAIPTFSGYKRARLSSCCFFGGLLFLPFLLLLSRSASAVTVAWYLSSGGSSGSLVLVWRGRITSYARILRRVIFLS